MHNSPARPCDPLGDLCAGEYFYYRKRTRSPAACRIRIVHVQGMRLGSDTFAVEYQGTLLVERILQRIFPSPEHARRRAIRA